MRVGLLVLLASLGVHATLAYASASVQPSTINFGQVDVRGLAVTRTLVVTNTGSSAIDVGAPVETGAGFTVTGSAVHLAPGASATSVVTFRPTTETDYTGMVRFSGVAVAVSVQGHGIDRHLNVAPPVVPDTFRNPGDAAPIVAVTVSNGGDANLAITSAAVTGGPVWTLLDDAPVDIPGRTTFDFHIRFAPDAVGPAPPGTLVLDSNDGAFTVPLAGTGVARRVSLGPDLDLGYIGVGDTLHTSVQIVSSDAEHDFTIASVTSSDAAFVLAAPPTVGAGASVPLDVEFAADVPGDYTTTTTLFLDEDPEVQDTVTLTAHAVYLDAQGGGGCSAAGGSGGGLVLVIAIGLLGLPRRQRRQRRRRPRRLVTGGLLLASLSASADPARNLDVSIFDPTPATVTTGFQLVSPDLGAAGDGTVTATLTYAAHPLVLASPQTDDVAIANRATLVLGGAWAVRDQLELGAHLPLFIQNGDGSDPQTGAGTPAVSGHGMGNFTVHAKAQLVPGLGAIALVTLPTASDDRFAGEARTSARLLALATFRIAPRVTATWNFGALLRPEVRFASYTERSAVAWGAGAAYAVNDALSVTGELFGELVPGGHRDAMNQGELSATTELLVGARDQIDPRFVVGAAIGRGVIDGPGAPAFRALVTLTFAPARAVTVHVAQPSSL